MMAPAKNKIWVYHKIEGDEDNATYRGVDTDQQRNGRK